MNSNYKDLILTSKDGIKYSFENLYINNCNNVYYCAFKILKNHQDSQDVLQETFLKAIVAFEKLDNVKFFPKWLKTITVRECFKLIKKKKKLICYENISEVIDNKNINVFIAYNYENLIKKEQIKSLYKCIRKLDSPKYNVVVLYFFKELSLKEMSIKLNCPVGTIKSRLHIAKKKLYKLYEESLNS